MQCSIKRAIIVFCCLIISHSIYAQEEENEDGFFGSVGLGYGIITGRFAPSEVLKSNIFDNDSIENETIKSYDESGKDFSFGSPLPLLQLGYAIAETGTRFSLGSDLDSAEIGGLSLNMMQSLKKSGTLHIGVGELIYYAGLFGNPKLSLIGLLNYSKVDSDITFFESSSFLAGTGLLYRF